MLTNNDILKKIRVALELKDEDVVNILKLAEFEISKSELNALYRKPDHPNYKECGDQLLRNFLNGLIIYKRGPMPPKKVQIRAKEAPIVNHYYCTTIFLVA